MLSVRALSVCWVIIASFFAFDSDGFHLASSLACARGSPILSRWPPCVISWEGDVSWVMLQEESEAGLALQKIWLLVVLFSVTSAIFVSCVHGNRRCFVIIKCFIQSSWLSSVINRPSCIYYGVFYSFCFLVMTLYLIIRSLVSQCAPVLKCSSVDFLLYNLIYDTCNGIITQHFLMN